MAGKRRPTVEELAPLAVFAQVEREVLETLAKHAWCLTIEKGTAVVRQDDESNDVYVVARGSVRVNLSSLDGKLVTYQILEAGQMFGELAALDGAPRTSSVDAEADVELVRIPAQLFGQLVRDYASFNACVIRRLVELARWLSSKVFVFHTYNVRGRVCYELLRIHESSGAVEIKVTDGDLGSRVGTRREYVNGHVKYLKDEGIVERIHRGIRVVDAQRLRQEMENNSY